MISPTMLSESTATRSSVSPVEVWPELEPVSPAGGREGSPALGDGEPAPAAGAGATGSWACDRTDFLGPFINGQPLSQGFDAGPNGSSAPFAHAHECAPASRRVRTTHRAQEAMRSSPFFIGRLATGMYRLCTAEGTALAVGLLQPSLRDWG